MPTFYLDTSALLKRYKTEAGTPVIERLFALLKQPGTRAAISFLTVLEVIAAARRALKGGLLGEDEAADLIRGFLTDVDRYFVLRGLDAKLFIRAMEATLAHGLRTADALQLATALDLQEVLRSANERLIFLVDDQELYEAAQKEGLEVINPREQGALNRLERVGKGR